MTQVASRTGLFGSNIGANMLAAAVAEAVGTFIYADVDAAKYRVEGSGELALPVPNQEVESLGSGTVRIAVSITRPGSPGMVGRGEVPPSLRCPRQ